MISDEPAGAVLSADTNQGAGNWTLTAAQLSGLTITPPAHSDADFTLTVVARSTESGSTYDETCRTLAVTVNPVADAPALSASSVSGIEDPAIPLAIVAALVDASETLSIGISGVPSGALLSAGTNNGDGTWTLTPAQLSGLTITPPTNSDADFILTVVARSTESDGAHAEITQLLTVTENPVAETLTLSVEPASGDEDSPIFLSISAISADESAIISYRISGVRAGEMLSVGVDNGDGSWTLSHEDLDGLALLPRPLASTRRPSLPRQRSQV